MNEPKKKRGCLIPILVVMLAMGAFAFAVLPRGTSTTDNKSYTILGKGLDLTKGQETAIVEIFDQCGIGEIQSVQEFQSGEKQTSYWLADSETQNYKGADYAIVVFINNADKTVDQIYFHDHDIFIEGQIVDSIKNYYVDSESAMKYRTSSQMLVDQVLQFPKSAKYPAKSGWAFSIDGDTVIIQSTVTAKNAFGMEADMKFQVKYQNGNPISLILDGKEYLG